MYYTYVLLSDKDHKLASTAVDILWSLFKSRWRFEKRALL